MDALRKERRAARHSSKVELARWKLEWIQPSGCLRWILLQDISAALKPSASGNVSLGNKGGFHEAKIH